MTRKLKLMSFSAIAALAISAVVVMSASATEEPGGHITSSTAGTTVLLGHDEGANNHLVGGLGTIGCGKATYDGSFSGGTASELTITPTYSECTFSGGGAAVVTHNGCNYTFTIRKTNPAVNHSTVHLVCPTGKQIEVHLTGVGCTLTIKPQTPTSGGVTYTNVGTHVTVKVTVGGIYSERHGGLCAFVPTADAGSELTGQATVTASDVNGGPVTIQTTGG